MTLEEAQAFARECGRVYHSKCPSIEAEEFEADALGGYVVALQRFQPPGDMGKYARAYMRGACKEMLRQEARAHGLVRAHTRRCRQCHDPMEHGDKLHHNRRICDRCLPTRRVRMQKEAAARRWRKEHHRRYANRVCADCGDKMPEFVNGPLKYCQKCSGEVPSRKRRWKRYYEKHGREVRQRRADRRAVNKFLQTGVLSNAPAS